MQCYDAASKVKASSPSAVDNLNNKDQQRNSVDSSGGDSSGDDDDGNKEENHDHEVSNIENAEINKFNKYLFFLQPKFYSTLAR